jgi:imidazolonepropionase
MSLLLINNIGQLLAVENQGRPYKRGLEMSDFPIIYNTWLLIEDGLIKEIGAENSEAPTVKNAIDAKGSVLLPTYVDSHSHLVYASNRQDEFAQRLDGLSYEEIAARGGGIINSANKLRAYSEDALFEDAHERLQELIKMGTGALEIKSGYGLDTDSELKMLRVARRLSSVSPVEIKTTFLGAHALPPEYKNDKEGYINLIIDEMLPEIANENLADFIDVFCEENYFSLEESLRILAAGKVYGLEAKVHVNQFNSLGAVSAMVNRGALSLDHLEVMTDEDLNSICKSNTIACLLPGCSHFLEIPYSPARTLVEKDAIIALATDFNPGSAPNGNMSTVLSLACIKMKLKPSEALIASTLNGAAAIDLSDKIGSIEVGKIANMMILKPKYTIESIPYHFGHDLIETVILKGEIQ